MTIGRILLLACLVGGSAASEGHTVALPADLSLDTITAGDSEGEEAFQSEQLEAFGERVAGRLGDCVQAERGARVGFIVTVRSGELWRIEARLAEPDPDAIDDACVRNAALAAEVPDVGVGQQLVSGWFSL